MRQLDLTGVPDSSFETIPAGGYLLQIVKVDVSFETGTNVEKWKIKLQVIDDEHKGAILWDNWKFVDKGLNRIKYNFKQLGYDVTKPLNIDHEDLLGKVLYCSVSLEKDTRDPLGEKMQNRLPWDSYRPLDKHPNPTDAQLIAKNAITMFKAGGNVGNVVNSPTGTTTPLSPEDEAIGMDEIPF